MDHLGRHVIIELWGCGDAINDTGLVKAAMVEAVRAANVTLLNIFVHAFSPQGVTGVAVLSESHLSVHTWPEHGYVAADVFTCGETTRPHAAAEVLAQHFAAKYIVVQELERGVEPPNQTPGESSANSARPRRLARV